MHTLDKKMQSGASPHSGAMPPLTLPGIAAGLAFCGAFYWGIIPSVSVGGESAQLGGTLASVGATMLGFLLAALAVLASINHTHLVAMMRRNGHYIDLLATLFWGCAFFLICTVAGFALAFGAPAPKWFLAGIVAIHIGAFVSLLDIGRKFRMVLTHLT